MDRRLEKEDMVEEMKRYLEELTTIREKPFYYSCDTIHQNHRNICNLLVGYCQRFDDNYTMDIEEIGWFFSEANRIKSTLDGTAYGLGLELKDMIQGVTEWLEKREKKEKKNEWRSGT